MFHPAQGCDTLDDSNCVAVSEAQVLATGISNPHCAGMFSEMLESSQVPWLSTSNLQCPRCHKVFTRPSSVVRHQAVCQNVSLIPCEFCDRSFTRIDNLHRHVRHKHRADNSC